MPTLQLLTTSREPPHGSNGAIKESAGSEASIVMGESPFKSVAELMREKRGPVLNITPNAAMILGTQLEPTARQRYIARTGKKVDPICLQSNRFPWLRASLDGLALHEGAAVEIKCGRSAYWNSWRHRAVPHYYFGQLQHILAVTHLDSIDFWAYWPGRPEVLIPVKRNDQYIDRLLNKELEFWNTVQNP